jgi:uncharacterized protein YbjT (DUF2867 family)
MPTTKITLLGATGLIGSHVLKYLTEDDSVSTINVIVRRQVDFNHPKVKLIVIDFSNDEAFQNAIEPESTIFYAIGTTNKNVSGDKEKYRKVDYDIPVNAAKFGKDKGCKTFVLVSSIGADSNSSSFYTKLKGEVEDKISSLDYDNLHIFQPSLLLGDRKEFRIGERLGQFFMTTFSFLLPSKYKPVQAKDVAKAMLEASKNKLRGKNIYHYHSILDLSKL